MQYLRYHFLQKYFSNHFTQKGRLLQVFSVTHCWLLARERKNFGTLSRLLKGTVTMFFPGRLWERAVWRIQRGVRQTVSDSRGGQETRKGPRSLALVGMALRGPWTFQLHRPHVLRSWHDRSHPPTLVAPTPAKYNAKQQQKKKWSVGWWWDITYQWINERIISGFQMLEANYSNEDQEVLSTVMVEEERGQKSSSEKQKPSLTPSV